MEGYPRNEFVQLSPIKTIGKRCYCPRGRLGPEGQCPEFRSGKFPDPLLTAGPSTRFRSLGTGKAQTFLSGRHPRVGMSLSISKIDQGRSLITGGRLGPPMLRAPSRTFEFSFQFSLSRGLAAGPKTTGSLASTSYTVKRMQTHVPVAFRL